MDSKPLKVIYRRLDREHNEAIGKVAVEWAFLELQTHQMFCHVLGIEWDIGRKMAARVRRMETIFSIMLDTAREYYGSKAVAELESIRSQVVNRVEKQRNEYIHATWWHNHPDQNTIRGEVQARPEPKELGDVPISQIEALADEMIELGKRMRQFMVDHPSAASQRRLL